MARNGSGTYSLPSGNPVVTGTTISSTDFNNTMTDLATAMSGSLAADGQTAWTGNQAANGNKVTGLGNASSAQDAATFAQVMGQGQTVTNILASRALSTAYTNSTTRPILVHVRVVSSSAAGTSVSLSIGGVSMSSATVTSTGAGVQVCGVVPPGVTYSAALSGAGTLNEWVELR